MSTPISEYVNVTVTVTDALVQAAGFGTPGIYDEFSEPAAWDTDQRVQAYTSLTPLAVDFATTTKVYKAASAMFAGSRAPTVVKVLRGDSGDANLTAALNAIEAEDSDWFGLVAAYRLEADINEIAAWVSSATYAHIYIPCSEDVAIYDSGDSTDIASDLGGFAYNRTGLLYSQDGGVDETAVSITVVSLVATVTQAGHGLRVGDPVTLSGANGTDLNGNHVVATIPLSSTWTFATTEGDGADANNGAIAYFARYTFPEARWVGHMLPTQPGEEDWTFKPLTGQTPTPLSLMTLAQQQAVKAKNANIYTAIGGVGATQIGVMASGRFIDTQIGMDWLEARLGEAVMLRRINSGKIPFTQAGINSLLPEIVGVIETGERNGLLGVITGSTSGETYRITMPQIEDISAADKISRTLPAILVTVQLAGSIVTFSINVTALI